MDARAVRDVVAALLEHGAAEVEALPTWGDNSVSNCRSYSRAKRRGTSAGAFHIHPMALSLLIWMGVPRGHVGPLGPLELAALVPARRSDAAHRHAVGVV